MMNAHDRALRRWIDAPTQEAATQAIIDMALAAQERYVPAITVGEPQDQEWQPAGHEPPEPRRTGVPAAWIAEI